MTLEFDVNGDGLLQLMLDSDIGIGHYGISAYEMASVGLPFAAIAHTDEELIKGRIGEYDFCLEVGLGRLLKEGDIAFSINKLMADKNARQELSENGMKVVDAKGLVRVTNLILDILKGEKTRKD